MTTRNNKQHFVLITAPLEAHWLERLQKLSPDLQVRRWSIRNDGAIPDELWQEVEILYISPSTTLPSPERLPHLRWVQLYSAGANQILDHPLFKTPVIFTTTSGLHSINIGEYVFTMLLAWFHRFPRMLEYQQRGEWPPGAQSSSLFLPGELWGKSIGIVGYGSIGRQVARLASAFGMHILAMQGGADHSDHGFLFPGVGDPEGTLPDHYYTPHQLHLLLQESDVVVIAVPLTPQTEGMFDEAAFRAMKPSAFLVNIARGDVCDEAALVRALQENQIGGAALDVFHQEPLPTEHPLWHLPNVFISPHISGLTPQYNERAALIFAENLRRYLANQPLYNVVDKAKGY